MLGHRHPMPSHLQLPRSFLIKVVFMVIWIAESIRTDHVWEDFPGGEIKGLSFMIAIERRYNFDTSLRF